MSFVAVIQYSTSCLKPIDSSPSWFIIWHHSRNVFNFSSSRWLQYLFHLSIGLLLWTNCTLDKVERVCMPSWLRCLLVVPSWVVCWWGFQLLSPYWSHHLTCREYKGPLINFTKCTVDKEETSSSCSIEQLRLGNKKVAEHLNNNERWMNLGI